MHRLIPTGEALHLLGGPEHAGIQGFPYAGAPYGSELSVWASLVEHGRPHPEIGRVTDRAEFADTLVGLRERRVRGTAVPLTGGAR
ncbi:MULTISPECIES: hypothetical protein [unclassified Streptomyces]|uniref:hypothetical protein n=1 Tax=unclassified Streptomyces TaxID=2593676 RepID=UPI00331CBCA9